MPRDNICMFVFMSVVVNVSVGMFVVLLTLGCLAASNCQPVSISS